MAASLRLPGVKLDGRDPWRACPVVPRLLPCSYRASSVPSELGLVAIASFRDLVGCALFLGLSLP